MAETPSPAYLWYPSDILSSGRVSALSALEELWYRRALDHSWMCDGVPAEPGEFAGWIGRGCTVVAATKIIAKFFVPHKRDSAKVVNPRQEKERTKLKKKKQERSKAGIESGRKRREHSKLGAEQMLNKNGTKPNIPIPISSPISFPNQTLKRWIQNACAKKSQLDLRLVEVAVIETWLKRKEDSEPIRSVNYFFPEIERVCSAGDISAPMIDGILQRRREQAGLIDVIKEGL